MKNLKEKKIMIGILKFSALTVPESFFRHFYDDWKKEETR